MSTLYIVATPIGNLKDITLRALETLKEVDFIICEDTRVTSKLLAHYEIQKSLIAYFQHSHLQRVDEIIKRLKQGQNAVLVTDAGTPGISDPGGVLVNEVIKRLSDAVKVVPIPGPCAAIAALSISGFPTDKFLFLGFPPHKKGRQKFWKRLIDAEETVVFYESCHRIMKSLNELKQILDSAPLRSNNNAEIYSSSEGREAVVEKSRQVVVCRELTKMFESIYRGTMEEVLKKVTEAPQKGEYAVVVSK